MFQHHSIGAIAPAREGSDAAAVMKAAGNIVKLEEWAPAWFMVDKSRAEVNALLEGTQHALRLY
jgi:hypothetical protein